MMQDVVNVPKSFVVNYQTKLENWIQEYNEIIEEHETTIRLLINAIQTNNHSLVEDLDFAIYSVKELKLFLNDHKAQLDQLQNSRKHYEHLLEQVKDALLQTM